MMSAQPKSKILIIVIGILLAANIALLAIFFMNRPDNKKPERKGPMTGYLKNEIGFTPEQMVKFDTIKSEHRREVKTLFDGMRSNKEETFKGVGLKHFADSALLNAASYSAAQQNKLELLMLQHLKAIRDICTPAQQAKFDTGFYKIMMRPRGDDKQKD